MRIIDIAEVLDNFEQLIEEAAQGHAFIIAVNGEPKVKVVPLDPNDPALLDNEAISGGG